MEQNFLSNQEPAELVAQALEPVQEAPEPVAQALEPVQEAPEPVQEAPEPVQNGLLDYIIENALLNARFKTDFEVKSYKDALGKMFANTECYNSSFKGCKSFTANPTTYKLFVINNMLNVAMNRIRWNNIKPILTAYQYKHIVNAYKKTIFNVDWYNEMFRNSKDDPTVCEQLENETKNFISTFSNYLEKGIFSNKYKKNAAKQVKFLLNCMNLDEEEKKEIYYFRYLSESQILSSVSWDIHRASWMGSDEVEEKVDTICKTLSYMQDELVDEDFERAKEKMKKVSRLIYKYRKALQSPIKMRENYRHVNEFIQEFYNEFNDEVKKAQAKDKIKNEKEQYWSRVINCYYVIPISKYRAEYKKKEVAMYGYDDKANVFFKIKDLRKFCNQPYRENGLILKEIKPFRGIGNIKKEDEIIYINIKTAEEKVGKVTDFFPNYTKNVKSVEQPDLEIVPTIPDQVHTPRLATQPAHNLEIVPTIPDQVHTPRLAAQQAHNLEIEMVALNAPVPAAPEPVQEAPEPIQEVPEPAQELEPAELVAPAPEPAQELEPAELVAPAPEPAQEAPEPVQEAPEPIQEVPEPAQELEPAELVAPAPEPAQEAPEPIQEAPEPIQEVPEPAQELEPAELVAQAPKPIQEVPEPVQEAPASTPAPAPIVPAAPVEPAASAQAPASTPALKLKKLPLTRPKRVKPLVQPASAPVQAPRTDPAASAIPAQINKMIQDGKKFFNGILDHEIPPEGIYILKYKSDGIQKIQIKPEDLKNFQSQDKYFALSVGDKTKNGSKKRIAINFKQNKVFDYNKEKQNLRQELLRIHEEYIKSLRPTFKLKSAAQASKTAQTPKSVVPAQTPASRTELEPVTTRLAAPASRTDLEPITTRLATPTVITQTLSQASRSVARPAHNLEIEMVDLNVPVSEAAVVQGPEVVVPVPKIIQTTMGVVQSANGNKNISGVQPLQANSSNSQEGKEVKKKKGLGINQG